MSNPAKGILIYLYTNSTCLCTDWIHNFLSLGVQERFVEIAYAFHVVPSQQQSPDELVKPKGFFAGASLSMAEYEDQAMICNYRFLRDFSPGVQQSKWLASGVHHFQLKEYLVRNRASK